MVIVQVCAWPGQGHSTHEPIWTGSVSMGHLLSVRNIHKKQYSLLILSSFNYGVHLFISCFFYVCRICISVIQFLSFLFFKCNKIALFISSSELNYYSVGYLVWLLFKLEIPFFIHIFCYFISDLQFYSMSFSCTSYKVKT